MNINHESLPLNPPPSYTSFEKYIHLSMEEFLAKANDARSSLRKVSVDIEKIRENENLLLSNTVHNNDAVKQNRAFLQDMTITTLAELQYIKTTVETMEPSKPSLSELHIRNSHYKDILSGYKDLLDDYITLTLDHQRQTTHLFEEQIKLVNPLATSFDLERAAAVGGEEEPSVFVQVLMQRGVRKNDQQAQHTMKVVLQMHHDLRLTFTTFEALSGLRGQVNILVERYRRRWPVVIREGGYVYVIDDDLSLLEKSQLGTVLDFDKIMQRREIKTRMVLMGLSGMMVLIVVTFIIVITLYWAGKIFQ
jgi:t-SNARE complex subunit (syntaxin)